jgi:SAM-dependent methyltransferase
MTILCAGDPKRETTLGQAIDPERRRAWLEGRREQVRADYDAEAPTYDDHLYPAELHGAYVERLLERTPESGRLLDAPCGTGRYFARIARAGRRVVGIDQSAGMLARAAMLEIAEELVQTGLQELDFVDAFDGALTVDAMENVPPEDWPTVVANVRRALHPGASWYVTIEETSDSDLADALGRLSAGGQPAVHGEVIEGDVAGYHFYPGRERAMAWLSDGGFTILAEEFEQQDGWGYRHFLLQS